MKNSSPELYSTFHLCVSVMLIVKQTVIFQNRRPYYFGGHFCISPVSSLQAPVHPEHTKLKGRQACLLGSTSLWGHVDPYSLLHKPLLMDGRIKYLHIWNCSVFSDLGSLSAATCLKFLKYPLNHPLFPNHVQDLRFRSQGRMLRLLLTPSESWHLMFLTQL